jgi:hypothetical protein
LILELQHQGGRLPSYLRSILSFFLPCFFPLKISHDIFLFFVYFVWPRQVFGQVVQGYAVVKAMESMGGFGGLSTKLPVVVAASGQL